MDEQNTPLFPMRINKYLAWRKYATRRAADDLIKKGKVIINGRTAVLGDKVQEADKIEVIEARKKKHYTYLAYHKPVDLQTEEVKLEGCPPAARQVYPVGRLDKASRGLLILTNDGRITDALLNPAYEHEKEYVVTTDRKASPGFKEKMESGVDIEGYRTRPAKIKIINDYIFSITLTEGKKHQIRRMCVALHHEVRDLKRTRIMNIELGNLAPSQSRPIEGKELTTFLKQLGFKDQIAVF